MLCSTEESEPYREYGVVQHVLPQGRPRPQNKSLEFNLLLWIKVYPWPGQVKNLWVIQVKHQLWNKVEGWTPKICSNGLGGTLTALPNFYFALHGFLLFRSAQFYAGEIDPHCLLCIFIYLLNVSMVKCMHEPCFTKIILYSPRHVKGWVTIILSVISDLIFRPRGHYLLWWKKKWNEYSFWNLNKKENRKRFGGGNDS